MEDTVQTTKTAIYLLFELIYFLIKFHDFISRLMTLMLTFYNEAHVQMNPH